MTRFVTFGETMVMYNATYAGPLKENGEYELYCAGAESNVALDLGKLGVPDLETIWVSRLGSDKEGQFILRELRGVTQVEAERHTGHTTGICYLNHLDEDRHIKTYRREGSAASRLEFTDVQPYLVDADLLHVTGITPALSETCRNTVFQALSYARSHNVPVSFDANYREQLWSSEEARLLFDEMLSYSWLFKVGHDEAEVVWGKGWSAKEYAKYFEERNGRLVIVTRGANGAIAFDGASLIEHPGYDVRVIDPTGAGDAFLAGVLGAMLSKHGLREFFALDRSSRRQILSNSLAIGNLCGALTCTRRGDTAAMPTMAEVGKVMEEGVAPLNR